MITGVTHMLYRKVVLSYLIGFAINVLMPFTLIIPHAQAQSDCENPDDPPYLVFEGQNEATPTSLRFRGCKKSNIDDIPILSLLLPPKETSNLTVMENPTVYWFLFKPLKGIEASFQMEEYVSPDSGEMGDLLMYKTFKLPAKAGIYAISIDKPLEEYIEYQLSLTLKCNLNNPSADPKPSGTIMRIIPENPEKVEYCLKQTVQTAHAFCVNSGFWYDGFDVLYKAFQKNYDNRFGHQLKRFIIDSNPDNNGFKKAVKNYFRFLR